MSEFVVLVQDIEWWRMALWALAGLMVVIGLVGTVVPAVPGLPMILGGAVIIAWLGNFQMIGMGKLTVLAVITIVGILVEWLAQMMGAKRAGASPYGVAGVLVGTVIGLFFGLVGILFFPLAGAFIGEYIAKKDLLRAGIVGVATWIGMFVGIVIKLILGIAMVGIVVGALLTQDPSLPSYSF